MRGCPFFVKFFTSVRLCENHSNPVPVARSNLQSAANNCRHVWIQQGGSSGEGESKQIYSIGLLDFSMVCCFFCFYRPQICLDIVVFVSYKNVSGCILFLEYSLLQIIFLNHNNKLFTLQLLLVSIFFVCLSSNLLWSTEMRRFPASRMAKVQRRSTNHLDGSVVQHFGKGVRSKNRFRNQLPDVGRKRSGCVCGCVVGLGSGCCVFKVYLVQHPWILIDSIICYICSVIQGSQRINCHFDRAVSLSEGRHQTLLGGHRLGRNQPTCFRQWFTRRVQSAAIVWGRTEICADHANAIARYDY